MSGIIQANSAYRLGAFTKSAACASFALRRRTARRAVPTDQSRSSSSNCASHAGMSGSSKNRGAKDLTGLQDLWGLEIFIVLSSQPSWHGHLLKESPPTEGAPPSAVGMGSKVRKLF